MPLPKLWVWVLVLFGVGCAVSNSLMSAGVYLWGGYAFLIYTAFVFEQCRKSGLRLALRYDTPFWIGLAYCLFVLMLGLGNEVGPWLLFLFWVVAFAELPRTLNAQKLFKIDVIVAVAYLALWAICLYQKFWLDEPRVFGVHRNPNRLACAVLPPIIYFGTRIVEGAYDFGRTKLALLPPLAVFLILHIVVLTGTRSVFPFIAIFGLTLCVQTFKVFRERFKVWMAAAMVGALASLLGFVMFTSQAFRRFEWSKLLTGKNVLSRIEIWKINWQMFKESPIVGTGFRQNLVNVADHPSLQPLMHIEGRSFLAHNTYLQVLTESGIVGFLLFFGFLGIAFVKRPYLRWYIFSILLVGFADTSIHLARTMPSMIFFITLAGFAHRLAVSRVEEGVG
jgi:O-antigen ligase